MPDLWHSTASLPTNCRSISNSTVDSGSTCIADIVPPTGQTIDQTNILQISVKEPPPVVAPANIENPTYIVNFNNPVDVDIPPNIDHPTDLFAWLDDYVIDK